MIRFHMPLRNMHTPVRTAFWRITLFSLLSLSFFSSRGMCDLSPEPLRRAPEIKGSTWFNVDQYPHISLKSLRGSVILLIFWDSQDLVSAEVMQKINALRDRYKDRGLEVIGVHDSGWGLNVSEAMVLNKIRELDIRFPVVMDSEGTMRVAYDYLGGESLFLIDRKGYIRGQFIVGLPWKDIELMLQMLLEEGHSRQWELYEKKKVKGV